MILFFIFCVPLSLVIVSGFPCAIVRRGFHARNTAARKHGVKLLRGQLHSPHKLYDCRFSARFLCFQAFNLFWYSVIFSRVSGFPVDTFNLVHSHIKFLLHFLVGLPIHQPIPFDTLIVQVVAFYLAGVAGIALHGVDAASVCADNNAYMVCAAV